MLKIYSGTAGWSYKDWVPSFYPKQQSQNFDWLEYYSHYFNCVEVNSTYYSYISDKIVEGWIRKTESLEDFLFTIKLHQDFTHKRIYDQEKIKAVSYNLDILSKAGRFGCLLIQFPYSFSFTEVNFNYIRKLKEIFDSFNCFVEVRHKSWFNKKVFEALQNVDLGFTTIDQPMVGEAIPFEPVVINGKAYIRFHGRNREAWINSVNNFGKAQTYEEQNTRYDYFYSPGELIGFEQIIVPLIKTLKEIYIIFNNHPHGQAPANALQMINLLEKRLVEIPKNLINAFPRLNSIAQPSLVKNSTQNSENKFDFFNK